jgi:mediator of RNA polymerase II transcription subunit 12
MGGEAKWIRDFTVCVEQFVESIISTCGEKDFKTRINYAIRLATYFYSEYLLDREHYMDWIVSALENSPQPKLPMWLLIAQIYWKDILQYRKYGRRLAAALLNQLVETLNHPDQDILAPLSDRLKQLLKGLMASHPDSFVASKIWTKHRDTILSRLDLGDTRFKVIITAIDHRNSRLASTGAEKKPTFRQRFIQTLDETLSGSFSNDMARDFWQLDSDKNLLTQTLIAWSISSHRPGHAKIYLAARIIRCWAKLGSDITDAVLHLFDSEALQTGYNRSSFYHLVSELARSEHFSTPRYIQWLIARGGILNAEDVALDGPCATRLLAELPTHKLSDSMAELRSTLLQRGSMSFKEESALTLHYLWSMNENLPGMQANADLEQETSNLLDVTPLPLAATGISRTIKSELGLWLRQQVRLQMVMPTIPLLDDWDVSPRKSGTSSITASDLNVARGYLELIEDFSMLADVLNAVTSSNDSEVLASCADTLDLHLEAFSAIGASKGLFEALMTRLRCLAEETDSISRNFLVSLISLSSRLPEQNHVTQQLTQELARSDRKTAADACSPVSDHMAIVQTAEADFADEIEKIFASGNSMDQATLTHLFRRMAQHLESSWGKSAEQQRSSRLLLSRLRTFEPQQFDLLVTDWLKRILQRNDRPGMVKVFVPLVGVGCLSLPIIVSACNSVSEEAASHHGETGDLAQEALIVLVGAGLSSDGMTAEEVYHFRVKQAHMLRDHPAEVLTIICRAIKESASGSNSMLTQCETLEVFRRLVLMDTTGFIDNLVKPLLQNGSFSAVSNIHAVVDKLLLADQPGQKITTEMLLNIADDLSLPFCQVKLASMFSTGDSVMGGSEDATSDNLEAFDEAIESAVNAGKTTWASIVPLLDISVARHLRQRSEAQFLASFPSPKSNSTEMFSDMEKHLENAQNLLRIVDATSYSIATNTGATDPVGLAANLVSVLNNLWMLLTNPPSQEIKDAVIAKWLPLLIPFATIHAGVFEATKAGHESRAKAILALIAIFFQLKALESSTNHIDNLAEQIYDLSLHLVDVLSEDMRLQCIRSIKDNLSSPVTYYLFSFSPNPTEWLVLRSKEKIPSPAGAAIGDKEKLTPFALRRWEMLGEPTPNIGENDTSLSLTLFGGRKG